MIHFERQVSLRRYNTFGINAVAKLFCDIDSEEAFKELVQTNEYKNNHVLILGGGSNILLTKDFEGLVVHNSIKRISSVVNGDRVELTAGSGVVWHELVMHAVQHQWGGIENLALIPGTVGAAPIQNIGAYGVEIKQCIKTVEAIDRRSGDKRVFTADECQFGYRESIFKHELREKFFISSVTLTLSNNKHQLNVEYGAIKDTLKQMNVTVVTIQTIADAVMHIRRSKLPDPSLIGNAGSFFKNPVISIEHFNALKHAYPTIPGYSNDNQQVKVPAGWLIEQCGWKGKRVGHAGVHQHQALVLVNYDDASGDDILQLSQQVQSSVRERFSIDLHAEVNII